MKIDSRLNEDRSLAEVTIGGETKTMTAAHVEAMIQELGVLRESMTPIVSAELLLGGDVRVAFDPRWVGSGQAMGSVLLHVRHQAFGWMNYAFPEPSAQMLSRILSDGAATLRGEIQPNDPARPGSRDAGIERNDGSGGETLN